MAASLKRVTSSLSSFPQLHLLLFAARNFSTRPERSFNRLGFEVESESEPERNSLQKLEDAVHRVVVRRSQPDWLPFRPGSSYWVPPKSQSRGYAHVMTDFANSLASSPDPAMVVDSARSWPSSEFFLQGAAPSAIEVETIFKHTIKSEDDEG